MAYQNPPLRWYYKFTSFTDDINLGMRLGNVETVIIKILETAVHFTRIRWSWCVIGGLSIAASEWMPYDPANNLDTYIISCQPAYCAADRYIDLYLYFNTNAQILPTESKSIIKPEVTVFYNQLSIYPLQIKQQSSGEWRCENVDFTFTINNEKK